MAETTFDTAEVGEWMLECAIGEWLRYDDEGTFTVERYDGGIVVNDPDEREDKGTLMIPFDEFYKKHKSLIYEGKIEGYRLDWILFATRLGGADTDDYDSNTTDAVLQNMLYGEVIYG